MNILEDLVSPLCGVVTTVHELIPDPGGYPIAIALARPASMAPTVGHDWDMNAGGAGWTASQARAAAIGEVAERYAATFVDDARLTWASWRDVGTRAVHPDRFRSFTPAQLARPGCGYRAFTEDSPTDWVEGTSLTTGRRVLLPAETVFLGYSPPEGVPAFTPQTSTGLACAPSFESAALAAVLEVVERDAFTLTWSSGLSPRRIEPFTVPGDRPFGPALGDAVVALDLSNFSRVPVVLAVMAGNGVAVGCAAAATADAALAKATLEVFQTAAWMRAMQEVAANRALAAALRPGDIKSFSDHVLYWSDPDRAHQAAFLTANPHRCRPGDLPSVPGATAGERLDALVALLADGGAEAFIVDCTTPDIASARLFVLRAVVPAYCPLDVAHDEQQLGRPRRRTGAWKAGLAAAPLRLSDLNPLPHPFP